MIKISRVWTYVFKEFVDDVVNNVTDVDMVILDCLDEVDYYDKVFDKQDIARLLDITLKHNIPVKIATANINKRPALDKYPNVSVICWSTYWFARTYRFWRYLEADQVNLLKGVDIRDANVCRNFELTTPYICLNNIRKNHRSALMDMLAKNDLIKHGALTWRDMCHAKVDDRYPYKYWKPEVLLLDQGLAVEFRQETMPIEFNNAFMQLVTESDDTDTFFSEKTATPMFLNKPFLVASNFGFHKELKTLGFELYDELFDYSFDSEVDMGTRYDKLAQNLKQYVGLTPSQLKDYYNKVSDKIRHNRNLSIKYALEAPKEIMDLHLLVEEKVQDYVGPLNSIKYYTDIG
jgi:hypothetical protein